MDDSIRIECCRRLNRSLAAMLPGEFPLSRIVCWMDWAAEGKAYVNDLIEFKSRVNHKWERREDAVIGTNHLEQLTSCAHIR